MKELSGEKTFDQFLFYSFGLGILFRSHCNRHPLRLSSSFSPVDHDRSSIYLGGALLVSTWVRFRVFDSADCQGQTATLTAIQKRMPQLQMIPELLDCGSDGISDRSIAAADMFPSVRPFCAIGRYSRQYTWTHQIVFSQVFGLRRYKKASKGRAASTASHLRSFFLRAIFLGHSFSFKSSMRDLSHLLPFYALALSPSVHAAIVSTVLQIGNANLAPDGFSRS